MELDNKMQRTRETGHNNLQKKSFYCECKKFKTFNELDIFCILCGKEIDFNTPAKEGCIDYNNYPDNWLF